ncbi:MAG: nitrite reductase [Acidobacteria bacterium RIFCSPLOWO2_12_FULL_67_14]|nr:MAG: nitrite reductase [Acidobacteria bacterium RIFCSPLOWO2_02_FULL_67_21]OFW37134.1 MAG: nitrite reductase [Acidobacteria bacterium RIFCSPLOWO2_12_FULL_67_14]
MSFAEEHDIDEFVDVLGKYERGEISAEDWRKFRLVRGTYGQRQPEAVHMLRIKVPQGILTSAQLRAVAGVSTSYSRGFGHVTTRQNVQLHFVPLPDVEAAMRALADTGLTTREACGNSVRNITACPYAGVAEDEIFDVTPYAEAMTRYFLRHPLSASLPRKFKIAFEGCPEDHAVAAIHDIGWQARIVGGRRGFRVTVGGGTAILVNTGALLYDFLPAEEMLNVAEAVVRVFHRFGDRKHMQRNRMKFLIRSLGWDGYRARFEEALTEFRAEGGARLPFPVDAPPVEQAPDWPKPSPLSPQAAATLAQTPVKGPGIVPGTVRLQTLPDGYATWARSNVRRQRQSGYAYVTARLPLGDFTAGQAQVFADLAEAYSDGTVRLTIDQNVVFRWVPAAAVLPLYERLKAAGVGAAQAGTIADVTSCPGAETCRLAVTQSRGLGRVLTEHLDAHPELVAAVPSGDIKISGCPNGCGQHHIAALGFQGSVRKLAGKAVPQYFVLVGGGVSRDRAHFGKVVSKIPVHRLTDAVDRLVALYREQRDSEQEPLGAFFRRLDPAAVTEALRDLADLSPDRTTADDFIDLGESQVFAPEVMDGECAS